MGCKRLEEKKKEVFLLGKIFIKARRSLFWGVGACHDQQVNTNMEGPISTE